MEPGKQFEELNKSLHERKTFDCGREELNTFLLQFAARHREAGISKTLVLPTARKEGVKANICSFYTLSHTEIRRESLPDSSANLAKKLPRYPIPVLLVGQLAVSKLAQGQGLGKITLVRALRHCLEINVHLPSHAVVVDAIDTGVQGFYEQYGFKPLDHYKQHRQQLFMPMQTVTQLFS